MDPFGSKSEVDPLSGFSRVPWDESGHRGTDQGPREGPRSPRGRDQRIARRINGSRGGSQSRRMDHGPAGRIKASRHGTGPRGTDQDHIFPISVQQDELGPIRHVRVPQGESGPFKTK